jgi:hypothetical protein
MRWQRAWCWQHAMRSPLRVKMLAFTHPATYITLIFGLGIWHASQDLKAGESEQKIHANLYHHTLP